MRADLGRAYHEVGGRVLFESGDRGHRRQDGPTQRPDGVDSSKRRRKLTPAEHCRPNPQEPFTGCASCELGRSTDGGSRSRLPPKSKALPKPDGQAACVRPATQWSCQALTL